MKVTITNEFLTRKRKEMQEEIYAHWRDGETNRDIARAYKITVQSVGKICKKLHNKIR